MDEIALLAFGIVGSLTFILELIIGILRKIKEKISSNQETLKRALNFIIVFMSILAITLALTFLMWVSTRFVYSSLSSQERPSMNYVLFVFFALFILGFLFVHIVGYCFAGILNKWPWGGFLWPRAIDYIYYFFGVAVLALIVIQIYEQEELIAEALRVEILIGIYLFNLKLFKTSYELFPKIFKWDEGWVRDPFFGKII